MLKNFNGVDDKLVAYLESIGYTKLTYMDNDTLRTCFATRLNDNEIMILEEDFDTVGIFNVTEDEEEKFIKLFTGKPEEFEDAWQRRVKYDGRQDAQFALGLVKIIEE